MSIFRKQPQPPDEANVGSVGQQGSITTSASAVKQLPPPDPLPALFDGARVDVDAIYKFAKLSTDDLDRLARVEQLMQLLPTTESRTRDVVDATFHAFGVDRARILEASSKQLAAFEAFILYSHEHTQLTLDANAKRIAELETEIDRCRQISAKATSEGEARARLANDVLDKAQRVLDFLGDPVRARGSVDIDVTRGARPDGEKPKSAPPHATPLQRPNKP